MGRDKRKEIETEMGRNSKTRERERQTDVGENWQRRQSYMTQRVAPWIFMIPLFPAQRSWVIPWSLDYEESIIMNEQMNE